MKIGIIASLYEPYTRGGAEVFVSNIVGELKENHDVFVISTTEWRGFGSLFPRMEIRSGVRVYRFYPLNIFSFIHINEKHFALRILWSMLDFWNIHSMLVVRSILLSEKPACVMVHALKGLSYGVATLLNWMKVCWIFTPHDVQLVVPSGRFIAGEEDKIESPFFRAYARFTRAIVGSPSLVISSSRFLLDFYRSRGFFQHSRCQVLPSPIPNFKSIDAPHDPKHFLYLGQLERYKGVDLLIQSLTQLNDSSIRLTIVGKGSLEEYVQKAAQNDSRIHYAGYLSGDEKASLIAQCGYTIVSSRVYENSPSVVYESFAVGTPVIVSAIGGAAELVKDGVNGFVIKSLNPSDVLEVLLRAGEATNYNQLSQAAKETVTHLTLPEYCESLFSTMQLIA